MSCKNCNSDDIILQEYRGAFDWWLTYQCQDCKKEFHRCWLEVVEKHQIEPYWDMYFTLMWADWRLYYYRNLYEIK